MGFYWADITRGIAMSVKAELTIQSWGNSLAVRIPAAVARAAGLLRGQRVIVEAVDGSIVVRPQGGPPRMTLEQMVKAFYPGLHGGELMADAPRGAESRWRLSAALLAIWGVGSTRSPGACRLARSTTALSRRRHSRDLAACCASERRPRACSRMRACS